jgi:hypothetical protein
MEGVEYSRKRTKMKFLKERLVKVEENVHQVFVNMEKKRLRNANQSAKRQMK